MMTRLVILVDDRKRIEQHTTQEQQYKELLNIALERRDPTMVVHALTEGGYERLANKLNDDLKNESSKFSTGDSQNAGNIYRMYMSAFYSLMKMEINQLYM